MQDGSLKHGQVSLYRARSVSDRTGFSLTELMAVLAILGVLAALIVPRVVGHHDNAKRAACYDQPGRHRAAGKALAAQQRLVSGRQS